MAEAPHWDELVDSLGINDIQVENIEVSTAFLLNKLFNQPAEWNIPPRDPKNPKDSAVFNNMVLKWERIYSTHQRSSQGLKDGVDRLLADDGKHLKMIYQTSREYGVPFEVIFLALAESHWKNVWENHAYAAGVWQFIPKTGQEHDLSNIVSQSNRKPYSYSKLQSLWDERLDIEKSTQTAMKYLKHLKGRIDFLAKINQIDISDDQAWSYAMWSYNRWPRVKDSFVRDKWNAVRYSARLLKQGQGWGRRESANYVPKIWWIRSVLQKMYKRWEFE